MAAEFFVVGGEGNRIGSLRRCGDEVGVVRMGGVEVEGEDGGAFSVW